MFSRRYSFNIICIIAIIVLLYSCSIQKRADFGCKIINQIVINGQPQLKADPNNIIYGNYFLEEIYEMKISGSTALEADGSLMQQPDTVSYVFKKYILTDIVSKKCTEFAYGDTSKVISCYPLNEKKLGMLFEGEIPDLRSHLKSVFFVKDTIINNVKHSIVEDTIRIFLTDDYAIQKTRILINHDFPKNFPFHFFSTYLDNKFQGISIQLYRYDSLNQSFIDRIAIQKGLNQQDLSKITKYIAASKLKLCGL